MDEKKNRPKTAVLAFMQALQNTEGKDLSLEEKRPIKNSPSMPNRVNNASESHLYDLPSGKKCRFIPKTIDSHKCIVWQGNARFQHKMGKEELESLKASIMAQGQLIPVLARQNKKENKNAFTHEIIYGSRRLKACQELNINIKIIEADMPDEDALFFMDAENASREDLSLYEKATIYHQWIESNYFSSARELSEKLGLSKRWVNKLLALLKVPQCVVEALPNLKDLTKSRAEKLFSLSADNPKLDAVIQGEIQALKVENKAYTGDELFEKIFNALKNHTLSHNSQNAWNEKEIFSEGGETILTVKTSKSGKVKIEISKHLPTKKLSKLLENIEKCAKNL